MGVTAEGYARMLRGLLPPGRVWDLKPGDLLQRLLLAAADELVRIDGRAADLLRESDPRTASETLEDWERVLGLSGDGTEAERQAHIVALLVRRQMVKPVDFQIALAEVFGLDPEDVEVIETSAATAAAMGDPREIFRFHIRRDPDLPGTYDLEAAQDVIDKMKHSHTLGRAIESRTFLCDNPQSLCDRDLLGS